ncbi:hypothetical protein SP15_305 [Bacillus phage SP-15]|uniref:Uncharacterized protein n=1 Tax=Bacillus phage SP-15 TaxID=1792032 RepID=A0A127AX24_9CAUD|nr:hypothetical protein SP15_305 [Bacillus phage SP-15]AMM45113.1 hypothetical protein SP15_305 [Bacillus phage SP-15]
MVEFDHLRMQTKQHDLQAKIMKFVTGAIGSCESYEKMKLDVWVAWFDTSYKPHQLERRFINELEDVENEINNTTHRFRELIEVKCMERDNGLISVTVYFL